MRFQNDNMVLWYGTSDAPAPTGELATGSGTTVMIAVQPPSPSNVVQVTYRVNGGDPATVTATLRRQDLVQKVQYFSASLPTFQPGDQVDYVAVARSPGRQVPAASDAATFPSSFQIVGTHAAGPVPASSSSDASYTPPTAPAATGATAGKGPDKVSGYIFFEYGLPATAVPIRLYNLGFGKSAAKLGEITTDVNGYYSIAYDAKGAHVSLEVRAVDAHGKEVALCQPKHGAGANEVMNLVAPTSLRPVDNEFHRLSTEIGKELGGFAKLAAARENAEQRDLTLLSMQTGWDARIIALGASAAQLAATAKMSVDAVYALFRAGLPQDPHQLARIHIEEVEKALRDAREADIVKLDDHGLAAAKDAFEKYSFATLHAAGAVGSVSSFAEMLAKTGLTAAQQTTFAKIFFAQGTSPEGLWEKAEAAGIPKDKIAILQLQGKLFCLTLNNAPLAEELQKEIGNNPGKLADLDLHQPEGWKTRLKKLGPNKKALSALIPDTYGADTAEERLEAYTADLARRMRMSYPTYVVARLLETAHFPMEGRQHEADLAVAAFLKNAAGLGYELGRTPVEKFLAENKQKLSTQVKAEDLDAIVRHIKLLHRLHQITPSDESLVALFASGLKSAYDVSRVPYESFIKRYGHSFPSLKEADLVYRKAQQVSSTTFNFSSIANSAANSPGLFAVSSPAHIQKSSKQNLVKHYPTMENLFGSLDFCECKDCRSVLSPAAYLVDLLQFLDHTPSDWRHFLEDWKANHGNAPYPFHDRSQMQQGGQSNSRDHGKPDATTPKTPYEVLIERRPDLPNLPLTCENTNTVMPYIDIANEVLEYFVAHNALSTHSGHDTGKAKTEELIAEPQNLLPAAYDTLRQAKYPLTLPFDLWLETVRHFLNHFGIKHSHILEVFRQTDDLFAAAPSAYGWSDIFVESLGLSPSEHAIFTDPSVLTRWFALYGYGSEHEATSALSSAKTLARSLSISYVELAKIVNTGFVNPALASLVLFNNLELDVGEVFRYKKAPGFLPFSHEELKLFERQLTDKARAFDATEANAKQWIDQAWQGGGFTQVLMLAPGNDTCNFETTTLIHANGAPADASVYLRLNLFVRLWKKLKWSVEELDHALQVVLPKSYQPLTIANVGSAFKTGLLYLAHLEFLEQTLKLGRDGRQKLLTLWSNLPTRGKNSLYAQLFLKRSILKTDATFDNPAGNYLSDPSLLLADHLVAIQGALNLTAREVTDILADAGLNPATAPLSLDNVSLLYRYGLLAKALRISVDDLIALKALAGLDPFKQLLPGSVSGLADDYPYSQTIQFVEVARLVRESGFHVDELNYIVRHQFDPVGKYRQDPRVIATFAKGIAAGLRSIRSDQAVPADATSLTDDLIAQKVALVLPSDAASTFMSMWNGTVKYAVTQSNVPPANKLDPSTLIYIPAIVVSYDPILQAQKLTYQGFLTDTQSAALQSANPNPLLAALLNQVTAAAKDFYTKYLSGFLQPQDLQTLLASAPTGGSDAALQKAAAARRASLANLLFPYVQRQLSRQFVIQTLTTTLGADLSLIQTLASNANLLNDSVQPVVPLTDSFFPLADSNYDISTFASTDGSGSPIAPSGVASGATQALATANSVHYEGYLEVPASGPYRLFVQLGKNGSSAKLCLDFLPDPLIQSAATNDQAELSNMVDLKGGIPYRFTFDGTNLAGGSATLLIQGESVPKGPLTQMTVYSSSAVDRANRARILLGKTLQLIDTLPLDEREVRYLLANSADFNGVSFSALPTAATDDSLAKATVLFQQFLRLANYARMKRDLAGGSDDLISIFENARRTFPASVDPTATQANMLSDLSTRLSTLTRRDPATILLALQALRFVPALSVSSGMLNISTPYLTQEQGLQKLWRALEIIEKVGVSPAIVARWATPTPDSKVAADLRSSVKARYEPESWLAIAPSIFDKLRQAQRDALVAYITFRNGFADKDELFDYFLLDPGMEPVVQTSRLRLAISCVQTFIQRCLLDLEPEVQPSALSSDEWAWMKRYRVWQANREIFLFPENWLDPEFRDDKTDLFQELEGSLLQGDVSNDLAEDALFTYLKKLEALARLEIVTMCCSEDPLDPKSNILHVIGRSQTHPRQYYYRTYAHQMWTPWEQVSTSIDGDHIVSVIWNNRLSVFWLSFMEQQPSDSSDSGSDSQSSDDDGTTLKDMKPSQLVKATHKPAPPKVIQVQLNWAEYFQGKWTTPGSSGGDSDDSDSDSGGDGSSAGSVGNAQKATVDANFQRSSVSVDAGVEEEDGIEVAKIHVNFPSVEYTWSSAHTPNKVVPLFAGVRIQVQQPPHHPWGPWTLTFKLISKHMPPQIVSGIGSVVPVPPPFPHSSYGTTHWKGSNPFQVHYLESIKTVDNLPPQQTYTTRSILQRDGRRAGSAHQLTILGMPVHADTPEVGALVSPFFFADTQNTFFVEPSLTETTIDVWQHWAIPIPHGSPRTTTNLKKPRMVASFPRYKPPRSLPAKVPAFSGRFDPSARFHIQITQDVITDLLAELRFGGQILGAGGGTGAVPQRQPVTKGKSAPAKGARK